MKIKVNITQDVLGVVIQLVKDTGDIVEFPVSRLLLESVVSSSEAREELKDHLQMVYDFGILYSIALNQQRMLDAKLDELSKNLYKFYRDQLSQSSKDVKENQIKAEIIGNEEYKKLLSEKLEADLIVDIMENVVAKLLEDRRIILGKLVGNQKYGSYNF